MATLTTDSVPRRERVEFWADLVSRHVHPVRIEPAGDRVLRADMCTRLVGGLGVTQVSGQGIISSHTRSHVALAKSHVHCACVMLEGTARMRSADETVELTPGDVFITDSRHEFTLDLTRPARRLVIQVPTAQLDARIPRPETLAGAVFRDRPLARLWARNLSAGFDLAEDLSTIAATLFARHSVELLAELVDESARGRGSPSEAAGGAVYLGACRVIAAKFGEPLLTPTTIARAVGVSSRTLARAFAVRGETVMQRVFDERIARAARLLASPQHARRSITDVAFACGFNDLSHFGRVFARKVGTTPSQWRRAAR